MSTQKGNVKKSKPPKHANRNAFKNTMHDTSKRTKELNSMDIIGVCSRCKDILEWKIRYKKYKPLTQAKKCTRCQQKRIKHAYLIVCEPCRESEEVCAKCGQKMALDQAAVDAAQVDAAGKCPRVGKGEEGAQREERLSPEPSAGLEEEEEESIHLADQDIAMPSEGGEDGTSGEGIDRGGGGGGGGAGGLSEDGDEDTVDTSHDGDAMDHER